MDTTMRDGSVAIVEDDRVVAVRQGDPSLTHAERLPRDILTLLDDHALRVADVDLFAVADVVQDLIERGVVGERA